MTARLNLVGQQFSRLTVVECTGIDKRGRTLWRSKCVCGNFTITLGSRLKSRGVRSCGCLQSEATKANRTIHGQARLGKETGAWFSYRDAKKRCNNPKVANYRDYGGRGIKFLFTSFDQFFKELGPRPTGMSIDRIRNDGNYEPGNVKWSTRKEQISNRRTPRKPLLSTHCRNGHLYTEETTYLYPNRNKRACLVCVRNFREKQRRENRTCF
jgi:hypothetical protein